MILNFKGKEKEVSFTFNSCKYMADFDMSEINDIETKPFKIISVVEKLLLGVLNCDRKEKVSYSAVSDFLESYMEDGDVVELLTELLEELGNSSFFKSLQKAEKSKK